MDTVKHVANHYPTDTQIKHFADASGNVRSANPLVCFLYLLLRDELPAGKVEELMLKVEADTGWWNFCNGWTAAHAMNIAQRLGTEPLMGDRTLLPWEESGVKAEADWVRRDNQGKIVGRAWAGGQTTTEVDAVLRKCGWKLL